MEPPEVKIGAMRGTARLLIPTEQPKPALRLVKDSDEEINQRKRAEKDNEHGR